MRNAESVNAELSGSEVIAHSAFRIPHSVHSESSGWEDVLQAYAQVLDGMIDGVSLFDENGTIRYTNPAEDKMFGYAPGELVGQHISVQSAGGPEEHEAIFREVTEQLRSRGTWSGEWLGRKKDGAIFTTYARITEVDLAGRKCSMCAREDITERKEAQDGLKESEHRYRSIFEAAAVSIWEEDFTQVKEAVDELKAQGVTDFPAYFEEHPDFVRRAIGLVRIVGVNDASVRMFHAKSKDELLVSLHRIFLPETERVFAGELVALANGESSFVSAATVRTLDGEHIENLFTVAFPGEVHGRSDLQSFRNVLVSRMNITERKHAEEQLRRSRDQLDVILGGVADGITAQDNNGRLIYANDAALRLLGYSTEADLLAAPSSELLGKFELLNESGAPMDWGGLPGREALRGVEVPEKTVGWRLLATGEMHWSIVKATPVVGEGGRVELVISIFRDITERRHADAALRASEARFRTMADTVPVIVWVSDVDKRRTYFNKSWLEFTGRTLEQDLGYGWTEDLHPDDLQKYLDLYSASLDERKEFQIDYRLRRFDGGYRWVLSHGVPFFAPDGTFIGFIGSSVDISERVELEDRKDAFIALASHELKTPITSLKLFTQLLKKRFERAGDEELVRQFARMDGQIDKLTGLVRSLLDVSRIQAGKLDYNMEIVEVDDIVAEVVDDLRRVSSIHTIELDGHAGVRINADPDRIRQVLVNLIMNAIKFSPNAGKVIVLTRLDDEKREVTISVQDFGMGIPRSEQDKIFDRFFQVNRSSVPAAQSGDTVLQAHTYPGLGLGLYVCAEIVARHGGRLWVESEVGRGSTFFFTLPV
jgi:PAS domain S-box-containing protein